MWDKYIPQNGHLLGRRLKTLRGCVVTGKSHDLLAQKLLSDLPIIPPVSVGAAYIIYSMSLTCVSSNSSSSFENRDLQPDFHV